jgi:hypothetical protein
VRRIRESDQPRRCTTSSGSMQRPRGAVRRGCGGVLGRAIIAWVRSRFGYQDSAPLTRQRVMWGIDAVPTALAAPNLPPCQEPFRGVVVIRAIRPVLPLERLP